MKAAEMFSLQGRVALVTGASSGLGTQFAKTLAITAPRSRWWRGGPTGWWT
jgi:hypothetical protein